MPQMRHEDPHLREHIQIPRNNTIPQNINNHPSEEHKFPNLLEGFESLSTPQPHQNIPKEPQHRLQNNRSQPPVQHNVKEKEKVDEYDLLFKLH